MNDNSSSSLNIFYPGNDIPFRYSTYFRSSNLTSYKLCKQQDLDPHFHLRRCGCRVCLKVPQISKKCDCEYCDLEKELTLYFFHEIMAKGCLEDYQMKHIAREEEPSIRSSGSNKASDGSVEDYLKNEKVSFVDDKEHELRHGSSSEGEIKVVYAKEKRSHIHKRRKSDGSINSRKLSIFSHIPAADKKTSTEHETKTRHTGSRHKKSSKEASDDEPPTHNRERRKSESLKTIPIAASLQPITEDNQTELNEKLISTTNFEQDWLVKREEKFANIDFKNGNRYEGEVLDKVPHGIGTFYWADGTVYEGEFEDGSPTGRGRMQLPDMTEYIGIFYKGFFHGNGVYNIRNTNMVYSGNWKYGKKHGFGWLLYESDVWYEGEFQDDLRHGKGFFHFKDKSCYQGQYSKNKREGRGAMRWSNNDIYIGQWVDGIIDGFGEYSWNTEFDNFFSFPVQHHYNGSWVKGKRTGTGIMFFGNENGAKMAGFFQDNFKHGAAIVICGNGKSIEKNPLFYNDKPLHTTSLSNEDIAKESSSFTFNEQVFQSIMKNGISEKQWPAKCHASQVNTLLENAKQERGSLCSPIEIQINSPPDDVELYFYIEKALSMYVNAFDTIQFDIESIESRSSANVSKLQLSKWNLMTLTSAGHSKVKSYAQDNHGRPSFNQNVPVFNKSETRFQSTVRSEEKYLRNVITRYLPRLMEVYYHYATITSPKKIYFKHYMIRMYLWQLYLDIGITKIGISLVETDRLLDENPSSFVESCHHPFEHIYFFQFIQSLMGTALLVHYKSREEVHSSEGLMPYIFQKFLLERVFVLAGTHRGRCLFEYKDMLAMRNVYALYLKLGQPHTARTFLNAACTKKGEDSPCYKTWSENKCRSVTNTFGQNVNIIGHNFLYIPEKGEIGASTEKSIDIPEDADPFYQDLAAFRVLGPKVVTKCLSTICPSILKNGIICNMDYPMTFLEFYEVLIICALLLVARTKKKMELYKKLPSRTNRTEEDEPQEAELRKSSGKLKKKK
ncbi:uncharacterized protein LOC123310743 isoform X2 [Coccinella septempunctata]|uniref:uncharacterized protein LOC123310743 isoform X2 n=1 Tax=Coccinella septempunctata TaxID=41139 RepID=UPI001D071C55|nr:uncharacterized protein LOC123310743 isoform X2 [Coccinella septempunctata]